MKKLPNAGNSPSKYDNNKISTRVNLQLFDDSRYKLDVVVWDIPVEAANRQLPAIVSIRNATMNLTQGDSDDD
jgi:hypothetical protein